MARAAVMAVYVTASSRREAADIGRAVVRSRLAACANIIPSMRSIYWWDGKLRSGAETVLILKTSAARLPALIARVKALHSYQCPCIEAFQVSAGFAPYLAWVRAETAPRKPRAVASRRR
jgi:periplasmic divalent cation tolerance protein